MELYELDQKLSELISQFELLDPKQIEKCIHLSQQRGQPSLTYILLQEGYFPSETLFRLVAMIQNSTITCMECSATYEAGQFQKPRDFVCSKCGNPIYVETQVVLPKADTKTSVDTWKDNLLGEIPFEPEQFLGKTIGGVEIREFIGKGSMGLVFLGFQSSHNRMVALKLISPTIATSKEFISRFQREALTALQLKHPNIIQVFGGGDDRGHKYIIMEYIQGQTLQNYINQKGRISEAEALYVGLQVAEGLSVAHEQYIIHRDIKPDNIFLDSNFLAKIADFGIAKNFSHSSATQTGSILGTPHYMSPEQVQGKDVDFRSDLYSLGATLYHGLVGRPPFEGKNPINVMYRHVNDPLVFPREVRDQISPAMRNLILWLMNKERHRRPGSTKEVAQIMRKMYEEILAGKEPSFAPPRTTPGESGIRKSPVSESSRRIAEIGVLPPPESPPSSYGMMLVLGILFLFILLGGGFYLMKDLLKKPLSSKKKNVRTNPPDHSQKPSKPHKPERANKPPLSVFDKIGELLRKRKYPEAREWIQKNLKKWPKDKDLLGALSSLEKEEKEFDKQKKALDEKIKTAEELMKKRVTPSKIQWLSKFYQEGMRLYSYDPKIYQKYKDKLKSVLEEGLKLAIRTKKIDLFFTLGQTYTTVGEGSLLRWIKEWGKRDLESFKQDFKNLLKEYTGKFKKIQKKLLYWKNQEESFKRKLNIVKLKKHLATITQTFQEALHALYSKYNARWLAISRHNMVAYEPSRLETVKQIRKELFDYYKRILSRF